MDKRLRLSLSNNIMEYLFSVEDQIILFAAGTSHLKLVSLDVKRAHILLDDNRYEVAGPLTPLPNFKLLTYAHVYIGMI